MSDYDLARRVLSTWDYTDPAGSLQRFEAAAAIESDRDTRLVLMTQAARAHGLSKQFAEGDAVLDGLGELTGLADEPAARCLLERGRLRNSDGDPAAAVPLFKAAFHRAEDAGLLGLAADAAHMLAIAVPAEEQEEWARRGIAIAQGPDAAADPLAARMLAALLNNLGWTYGDEGRWAAALPLFERALAVREADGDPDRIHHARWARARALRGLGRYAEALAEQRELADTPAGAGDSYVTDEIEANERAIAGG